MKRPGPKWMIYDGIPFKMDDLGIFPILRKASHISREWDAVEASFFPTCQVRLVRFYVGGAAPPPLSIFLLPPPSPSFFLLLPRRTSSASS